MIKKCRPAASNAAIPLAIYLPHLLGGGAERMHLAMGPELQRRGFSITFVTHGMPEDFVPPAGCRVELIEAKRTLMAVVPLARYLSRERPALILSNLGHNNIAAIVAAKLSGTGVKVIGTQHNTMSLEHQSGAGSTTWLAHISRFVLRYGDGMIAVSQGVAADLAECTHLSPSRITTIYNPVVGAKFNEQAAAPIDETLFVEGRTLIGVGRMAAQKDWPLLIDALTLVRQRRDVRLLLLGEGPARTEIEAKVAASGLSEFVRFLGFVPDPLPYIKRADVLVMSSRYEGFGNVIVEALACGTQVVSTNCKFGPAEILENGRYGDLTPPGDARAMADAIIRTLDGGRDPAELIARGADFTIARAADLYANLIRRTLSRRRGLPL